MNKVRNLQKGISTLLIGISIFISIIERSFNYITIDIFFRHVLVILLCSVFLWITVKLKNLYFTIANLFLSIFLIFFTTATVPFFYRVNHCVILAPHIYNGQFFIKLNDGKSKNSISPTNNTILIRLDSLGHFQTKSDLHIPINTLSVAEMNGNKISNSNGLYLADVEYLKHDSIDGKYDVIKGSIRSKK